MKLVKLGCCHDQASCSVLRLCYTGPACYNQRLRKLYHDFCEGFWISRYLTDKSTHHYAVLHLWLHDPLHFTIFLQACSLQTVGSVVLRMPRRQFFTETELASAGLHTSSSRSRTNRTSEIQTNPNRKALRA
ncbi:hypothetical protein IG631_07994 [Alternaria alternata]|nr:hypothetical protein IG631_07994 [Alternaria alternata]